MGLVMCQGICTSQLDDYCGMHLIGEECIACTHTWNQAHIENAEFDKTGEEI